MNDYILSKAAEIGERVFIYPEPVYGYKEIMYGIKLNGNVRQIITENNFLAFGYHDLNSRETMRVFIDFFIKNQNYILEEIKNIQHLENLNSLEMNLYNEIYKNLNQLELKKLDSYNRIRKTLDFFIECIVALCDQISTNDRLNLVPLLFLPLDNYIFKSEYIFEKPKLLTWNIKRSSTVGDIENEKVFYEMQLYLNQKSNDLSNVIGQKFYRIYFDIFRKNRINSNESNLFLIDFK